MNSEHTESPDLQNISKKNFIRQIKQIAVDNALLKPRDSCSDSSSKSSVSNVEEFNRKISDQMDDELKTYVKEFRNKVKPSPEIHPFYLAVDENSEIFWPKIFDFFDFFQNFFRLKENFRIRLPTRLLGFRGLGIWARIQSPRWGVWRGWRITSWRSRMIIPSWMTLISLWRWLESSGSWRRLSSITIWSKKILKKVGKTQNSHTTKIESKSEKNLKILENSKNWNNSLFSQIFSNPDSPLFDLLYSLISKKKYGVDWRQESSIDGPSKDCGTSVEPTIPKVNSECLNPLSNKKKREKYIKEEIPLGRHSLCNDGYNRRNGGKSGHKKGFRKLRRKLEDTTAGTSKNYETLPSGMLRPRHKHRGQHNKHSRTHNSFKQRSKSGSKFKKHLKVFSDIPLTFIRTMNTPTTFTHLHHQTPKSQHSTSIRHSQNHQKLTRTNSYHKGVFTTPLKIIGSSTIKKKPYLKSRIPYFQDKKLKSFKFGIEGITVKKPNLTLKTNARIDKMIDDLVEHHMSTEHNGGPCQHQNLKERKKKYRRRGTSSDKEKLAAYERYKGKNLISNFTNHLTPNNTNLSFKTMKNGLRLRGKAQSIQIESRGQSTKTRDKRVRKEQDSDSQGLNGSSFKRSGSKRTPFSSNFLNRMKKRNKAKKGKGNRDLMAARNHHRRERDTIELVKGYDKRPKAQSFSRLKKELRRSRKRNDRDSDLQLAFNKISRQFIEPSLEFSEEQRKGVVGKRLGGRSRSKKRAIKNYKGA